MVTVQRNSYTDMEAVNDVIGDEKITHVIMFVCKQVSVGSSLGIYSNVFTFRLGSLKIYTFCCKITRK